MITTIIFDLGGVLFTNGTAVFIQRIADAYSIPIDRVHEVISGPIGSAYRSVKLTSEEFWNSVKTEFAIQADSSELSKWWLEGYQLIGSTKDLIQALRDEYKVYYLSDSVRERVDYLETKYHFMSLFDGGIFSYEAGTRKPDPKIYTMILDKAGVKPDECVYIDDKSRFLDPAREMGMHTILYESSEALQTDLQKIGIEV